MFFKGQKIGKYEILESLGSGGFGAVYKALDTLLAREVALKVPHQQTKKLLKMLKEPRLQASLDHPNIVKLHTVEHIDSVFFMVMEYVDGPTLSIMIEKKGKLALHKALVYLEQILEGVAFAHKRNIIHRDLRPSNIMIKDNNKIKIADFGTSRWLNKESLAPTKIGSPPYMAPEQFDGKTTFASDIYSIGCICYEMISGNPPVLNNNPFKIKEKVLNRDIKPISEYNENLPGYIEKMISKMMEPSLSKRYEKVVDIKNNLKYFFNNTDNANNSNLDHDILRAMRKRLKTRDIKTEKINSSKNICWNCRREIPPFSETCPHCGASQ